jgi:type I restriction enzyme S subunit
VLLSSRAPIGHLGIANIHLCTNQGFKNIICGDLLFNRYLFHILRGSIEELESQGRGNTFLEIPGKVVKDFSIPLPPLNVQKAVASFLDVFYRRLSGQREELPVLPPPLAEQRRIVARIEELAAKIEEARGLRRKAATAAEALLSAEGSAVFTKLEGYPRAAIADLGNNGENPVQTGPFGAQLHREEFVDNGVPVLNVGNVTLRGLDTSYLDHVTPEKAKTLARYELAADDLLFARTGATLGKVCLVPENSAGWLMTGHLFRVRFDQQRCLPSFALVALRDVHNIKAQVFQQVQGATRPGFNTTLLSRVKIPLPPISEQRRIVAYLESLQAKVEALKALQAETQAELDALLPSVLDKAFKGEL